MRGELWESREGDRKSYRKEDPRLHHCCHKGTGTKGTESETMRIKALTRPGDQGEGQVDEGGDRAWEHLGWKFDKTAGGPQARISCGKSPEGSLPLHWAYLHLPTAPGLRAWGKLGQGLNCEHYHGCPILGGLQGNPHDSHFRGMPKCSSGSKARGNRLAADCLGP